jgi:chromosome segregation ATPase
MRLETWVLIDLAVLLVLLVAVAIIGFLWLRQSAEDLRQTRRKLDQANSAVVRLEADLAGHEAEVSRLRVRLAGHESDVQKRLLELRAEAEQASETERALQARVEDESAAWRSELAATTQTVNRHAATLKAATVTIAALRPPEPAVLTEEIQLREGNLAQEDR